MENKGINDTRKGIIISLLCVFTSIAIYYYAPSFSLFIPNWYIYKFLNQMVFVIADIICLIILKRINILKFKWEGFATGFIVAGFWVIQFISLTGMMIYIKTSITASFVEVIFFTLLNLAIGISEEVAFRGILLNAFLDHFGNASANAIRLSIICSAIPFGLLHLLNAFGPDSGWYSSSYQAIDCVLSGILFGAIYYRSKKNLWVCIVIHAINDLIAMMAGGKLTGVVQTQAAEAATTDQFGSVPFLIIMIVICLWVTRKKKLENVYPQ